MRIGRDGPRKQSTAGREKEVHEVPWSPAPGGGFLLLLSDLNNGYLAKVLIFKILLSILARYFSHMKSSD